MMYKEINIKEVEKISNIDGSCYIHTAWREVNGKRALVIIDWLLFKNSKEWNVKWMMWK